MQAQACIRYLSSLSAHPGNGFFEFLFALKRTLYLRFNSLIWFSIESDRNSCRKLLLIFIKFNFFSWLLIQILAIRHRNLLSLSKPDWLLFRIIFYLFLDTYKSKFYLILVLVKIMFILLLTVIWENDILRWFDCFLLKVLSLIHQFNLLFLTYIIIL